MRAEVISIGTELLLGDIDDTNATKIAQALRDCGLDLLFRTTVGDNEERIATALQIALGRAEIVITTGGLGPTVDDVTREAIARATRHPLIFQQILMDQIAERFRHLRVKMTDNNRRQAYAPEGALLIENPVGTAPIFILETEQRVIMTLPGVPREMEYLLSNVLIPWIIEYLGERAVIRSRVLRTAGIGESQIDAELTDLLTQTNPTVGLAAHPGQTDIRITAKASDIAEADRQIAPIEEMIRLRLGKWIYGTGTQLIEEVVIQQLREQHQSLATVESGSGDLLRGRLRSGVDGSPESLIKCSLIDNVQSDATSDLEGTAMKLASETRAVNSATYGLAIIIAESVQLDNPETEIAIAVAHDGDQRHRHFAWAVQRQDREVWATTHGLAMLWRVMAEHANPRQV